MANLLLLQPGLSDAALLTGSESAPAFPVTGLQRKQLYARWRPHSLTPFIEIDLRAACDVRSIALLSVAAVEVPDASADDGWRMEGPASASATWRIRAAATPGDLTAAPGYDSGPMTFRQAGADDRMPVVAGFHWAADGQAPRQFRYWRIDVDDQSNPAGYVDFGRLYLSNELPFETNASWGVNIGYEDASQVRRGVTGGAHVLHRPPVPFMDMTVGFGSEAEMLGFALRLDRLRGVSRDILAILDHESPHYAAQRTVYGLMEQLAPVNLAAFRIFSKRYRVRGINP